MSSFLLFLLITRSPIKLRRIIIRLVYVLYIFREQRYVLFTVGGGGVGTDLSFRSSETMAAVRGNYVISSYLST